MATKVQIHWRANKPARSLPQEWLVAYYATVYELEAHAEQIAYELWLTGTIAGRSPRKSENVAGIPQSEPLDRNRGSCGRGRRSSQSGRGSTTSRPR